MGRNSAESRIAIIYGMCFDTKDVFIKAGAWKKFITPCRTLTVLAARKGGQGVRTARKITTRKTRRASPTTTTTILSLLPANVIDMVTSHLRASVLHDCLENRGVEESKYWEFVEKGPRETDDLPRNTMDWFIEEYGLQLASTNALKQPQDEHKEYAPVVLSLYGEKYLVNAQLDHLRVCPPSQSILPLPEFGAVKRSDELKRGLARICEDWELLPLPSPGFGDEANDEEKGHESNEGDEMEAETGLTMFEPEWILIHWAYGYEDYYGGRQLTSLMDAKIRFRPTL